MISREIRKAKEKWIGDQCKTIDDNMKKGNTEKAYNDIKRHFSDKRKK